MAWTRTSSLKLLLCLTGTKSAFRKRNQYGKLLKKSSPLITGSRLQWTFIRSIASSRILERMNPRDPNSLFVDAKNLGKNDLFVCTFFSKPFFGSVASFLFCFGKNYEYFFFFFPKNY